MKCNFTFKNFLVILWWIDDDYTVVLYYDLVKLLLLNMSAV